MEGRMDEGREGWMERVKRDGRMEGGQWMEGGSSAYPVAVFLVGAKGHAVSRTAVPRIAPHI